MKFTKRILSFLMALCMVIPMLPVAAYAESEEILEEAETPQLSQAETAALAKGIIASGECGNNARFSLSNDGVLTVSGAGAMWNYDYESRMCLNWQDSVVKVVVESGITHIGDYSFAGLINLSSIDLPKSLTSIGAKAFFNCSKLTSMVIPDSITRIGDNAFASCVGLTNVHLPAGLTQLEFGAFNRCYNLKTLNIPSGVSSLDYALFYNCTNLTTVELPDSLTVIDDFAFCGCYGLKKIIIPSKVTTIGRYAFQGCSSLSSITVPKSVLTIGEGAFHYCTSMTSLSVSTENPNYCARDNVLFNKDMTTLLQCADGKTGNYTIPASVTAMEKGAFWNNHLSSISSQSSAFNADGGVLFDSSKKTLIQYPCAKSGAYTVPSTVNTILESAFENCSGLTGITIPSSVKSLDIGVFSNCSNLKSVTFQGNAPAISEDSFGGVTATVYYPKGNSTYTDAVKQNYEGNLTWVAKDEQLELAAPAISSLANTTSGISVKWNAVEGAAKYKVQYKVSGGSYKTLTTTSSTSCTIAADKLTNGNKYYVRVCSVDANGNASSYSSSKSTTYAKQYKITYDANGGTGAPSAQTKTYGKTLTLRTDVPTRKGYTFAGWATSASGDVKYQAGGSYTSNSAKTLYAKWTANKYTIKFNGNGKDGGSMSSMTGKKYGTSYTLTANKYTRTGYNFVGWNTKADGSGTSYKDGASVKNLSSKDGGSITLYAQWKLKTYKVSFDANGGKSAPSAQTKTYGKTLTLTTSKPTRSGYSFQGWATSATGSVKYKAGADYTSNSSKTLYAVWKKK